MVTATFTTELGTKTWGVSSDRVNGVTGLTTGYTARTDDNESVEGATLTNERGLEKQTISFSSTLIASLGNDVRGEFESWKEWVGKTGILKVGGKTFGPNLLLKSVNASDIQMNGAGTWLAATLAYEFEESDEEVDASIVSAADAANTGGSAANITATTEEKAARKPPNAALTAAINSKSGGAA